MILDKSNAYNYAKEYIHPDYDHLVKIKLKFPYEWLDDFNKLFTSHMPNRNDFTSKLKSNKITVEEYNQTVQTVKELKCQNMLDYLIFYNVMDTLILADAMENYRNEIYEIFQLDPANFVSSPATPWQCMLRQTGVVIELISDYQMLSIVEKGIRGGMCGLGGLNYAEIKDTDKESILLLDANNLYGNAMRFKLPIARYRWVWPEDHYAAMRSVKFIAKVDLEYPEVLHESHKDYPLAPEKIKMGDGVKLCQTLHNKRNYVVHWKNLMYYMHKGLNVTTVKKMLMFTSCNFLGEYIDTYIDKRKNAKTDMEKEIWKLMINAVFGKTMENMRKRQKIEFVTDEKRIKKLIASPYFSENNVIIPNKLLEIRRNNNKIRYDKPILIGFAILELSKLWMFNTYHEYLNPNCDNIYW